MASSPLVYLDNNATTCVDPQVVEALIPYLTQHFGNASSSYALGRDAKAAVNHARDQVARMLQAQEAEEIIFLSGGTESINYALKGSATVAKQLNGRNHLITCVIEHVAVLETCRYLETKGFEVTYVQVDQYGRVNPQDIANAIKPSTFMVSIMHANNEVGTLQPIQEIVETVKNHPCHSATSPILVHTDASQSIGKVRVSVQELGVDFLTIAGHKLYAPKGIGALYIRKGTSIPEVLIHGAAHENGKRAGTENVAFDVALGKACELIEQNLTSYETLLEGKKKELLELLNKFCDKSLMFQVNGHDLYTLPNTLSISFPGVSAVQVLKMLEAKGICASAGSACHSHTKDDNKQASIKISHVLQAMGLSSDLALGTLRLSVGRFTTSDELRYAAHAIAETVAAVKKKI